MLTTYSGFYMDKGEMTVTNQDKTVKASEGGASPIKRPDEALAALGELFRSRNAVYGNTYKSFGRVMRGFFQGPITIDSEEDWNRLALFFHCADKLARYSASFAKGEAHKDSLDDLSVYSQLLQEYDAEVGKHKP